MQSVLHKVCSLFQSKFSKQSGMGCVLCTRFLKSLYCKRTKWYRQLQKKATYTITFPLIVKQWSNFPCPLILNTGPILVTLYLFDSCPRKSTFKAARGTFEIFTIFKRNVNCYTMKCISVMKKYVIKEMHVTFSTRKVMTKYSLMVHLKWQKRLHSTSEPST
jgi:hypothetical protein